MKIHVFGVAVHEVGLDEDAVELDRLGVQRAQSLVERVQGHLRFLYGLVPHLLVESDLAHGKEGLDIIGLLRVLGEGALHVAGLDGLLDTLFGQVLGRLLRYDSVRQAFEAEGLHPWLADETRAVRLWVAERSR